jgi:polygalacturonase
MDSGMLQPRLRFFGDNIMAQIKFQGRSFSVASRVCLQLSILLVAGAICTAQTKGQGSPYSVRDFGAVADGKTLDTQAIQAAIDACGSRGGGTVYFPAGTYLSGTIRLKSHIRLDLDKGALILGSSNVEDYPFIMSHFASRADRYFGRALIWGEGLHDIAITGYGTIDGQGDQFADKAPTAERYEQLVSGLKAAGRYYPLQRDINRPFVIRLVSCRNVLVENVTLRHSAMWMQHYLNCDFVTIRGVNVFNHGCRNNDMIDIDCSRNVVITGCFADTDDDALTLKSCHRIAVENVTVSNCVISSHCNAIKAGTDSMGGFKNLTITNCIIRQSAAKHVVNGRAEGIAGIALEIVDGGSLDGVAISNVSIEGTASPIFLRLGNRARPVSPDGPKPPVGTFRNVVIDNVVARSAGRTGCSIVGVPGHRIENVTLSNIKISFDGGGTKKQGAAEVPERENKYPESTMFGVLPAYGFFCRHVDGLTFQDVDLCYDKPDQRPALICDDVHNLKLDGFGAQVAADASGQIIFRNTTDALITGCRPPAADVFLRLEDSSKLINVIANDLSRVKTPFTFDTSTVKTAVFAEFNKTQSVLSDNSVVP